MKHPPIATEQLILDTIINNIPAMVFYKDLDSVYVAANNMFCRQLGTTPKDLAGKTDFDFYEEDQARSYLESDKQVIKTGGYIEGFEEEIHVDGQPRIFATRKVLLRDHLGKPYGIIGLSYDVTESRKTEQELIESRTRYKYMYDMFRLMGDNLPDMLWAKDMRKRYLYINKAMCEKLLNASDTLEPIGKTDMFFAERERQSNPDDSEWHTFGEICSDSDEVTMQHKAPGQFDEFGNVRGQFMYLDVHKAPILDDDGNIIGTVGSGRDITKQKLIEREFHALNQRNRAIIEALPDLMFLFDKQGTYLECYVSSSQDMIMPAEVVIGMNVSDYFSPPIASKTKALISECLRTNTIQTFEYEVIVNNELNYFEARLIRVEDDKVLCISRNITERKTLQKQLIAAKEKAEESSRLKSTLLDNMSHELRTPLNGILGFSEILTNELKEPDQSEMAGHIHHSGKRLMKTLESIMQLSQLESGIKAISATKIDLKDQIESLTERFRPAATAKGLFFKVNHDIPATGCIDAFFFTQAIANILENAIKFTREGGVSFDVVEVFLQDQRHLSIDIEDTGIGIAKEHIKVIFDEFRQVSEGQNRSFEGTGLGLTISKKMIDLLGGKITLETNIGKGSKFHILLPFPMPEPMDLNPFPEQKSKIEKTISVAASNPGQPSLLLVEDNEVNMRLTLAFLEPAFHIDWAPDGYTAIDLASHHAYRGILMDINLGPGMDGLETAREIKKINGYEAIPIVALTGYTMYGDKERLIKGGCTHYLPKPFTKKDITTLLHEIIPEV
jgi:PAS domain S-box-containing protein